MPEATSREPEAISPDPNPSPERIFLCTEGDASKFWRVKVLANVQTVRYGRIGTEGHELTKTFEGPVAASKATQKLIAEKLGKGYREVSEAEASAAHDVARVAMGEGAVTAPSPSTPRRPRKAGKLQTPPWKQLLFSFEEEEGTEIEPVAESSMPVLPEPESPSLLSFEF